MSTHLEFIPFRSLLSTVVDNRGRTCPTSDSGMPLIATNCILNNYLYPVFEKVRYVDAETYNTWFRGHPKPGDMIFVLKGTPGRVAWVPDPVDFCIAQDMVAIRANSSKIYPRYLFAALRSDIIQQEIEGLHVGSLIPHFKKGDFDDLKIPIPDSERQKFIGDFYFSVSQKIDLLHRQNKTLEALAQTLFRQWFVEEADSDVEASLSDFAENIRENVTADYLNTFRNYIGLEHVEKKQMALYQCGNPENIASNKSKFLEKDILFGKLRPYFHKVTYAPFDGICSTDILVIRPRQKDFFAFCLCLAFSDDFVQHSDIGSEGTRMPRTNWNILSGYRLPKPDLQRIRDFNVLVMPSIAKMTKNISQIHTLTKLRDTLLPKLMSGEVRVSI